MNTDYKIRTIIRSDRKQTTTVRFGLFQGSYEDVDVETYNAETGESTTATVSQYRRTTPISNPLFEKEIVYEGILSQEELITNLNKEMEDIIGVFGLPIALPGQKNPAQNTANILRQSEVIDKRP